MILLRVFEGSLSPQDWGEGRDSVFGSGVLCQRIGHKRLFCHLRSFFYYRKRSDSFGKKGKFLCVNGELVCLSIENKTPHVYEVAKITLFENFVFSCPTSSRLMYIWIFPVSSWIWQKLCFAHFPEESEFCRQHLHLFILINNSGSSKISFIW